MTVEIKSTLADQTVNLGKILRKHKVIKHLKVEETKELKMGHGDKYHSLMICTPMGVLHIPI